MARAKSPYIVAASGELAPGERKFVQVAGREVGLFNVGGRLQAVSNVCPHRGAPVCRGTVTGTALPSRPGEFVWGREGQILRCPWHGWEFDLLTGVALAQPTLRLKQYPVTEVDGRVLIWL
jgi:3-phenylpropionate/trans-cinnamate dioxygenase ferredoxin subunit